MFKKILIANRGEIACRIIKTARRMGIACVAIYSEADRRAPYVGMADEAILIGPAPAAQSYLSIEAILAACHASGAEAVHPGYGFLSESAVFAEAVDAAGLSFIGPHRRALSIMGDKIAAKELARTAGVALLPGSRDAVADRAQAIAVAEAIGYPIMLKPAAGGGGKGMHIARTRADIETGFAQAQSESASAFGDARIFIEKFIERPRHIEIQILGDRFGRLIHLGERECSIQRRHQKIIEEAPSPFVDAELRARMAAQAFALAAAVDYDSAGTVEFLVDPRDRRFYFLEMNTRLQVEHPVTELVAGLDLVEKMIRIAAGERLGLTQNDIVLNGAAIECRIYAEDPERGFLPSTGRLITFRPPQEETRAGITLRHDMGVVEGSEILPHYDPMLGKLIVHAPTRAAAIAAQADALDRFVIEGIHHNIFFLAGVMQNACFQDGDLSTDFLAQNYPQGYVSRLPSPHEREKLIVVAASIDHARAARRTMAGPPAVTERAVLFGRERIDVRVEGTVGGLCVRLQDSGLAYGVQSAWHAGQKLWAGAIDGESIFVQLCAKLNDWILHWRGTRTETRVLAPHQADLAALMPAKAHNDAGKILRCPMPGLVRAIYVVSGQSVRQGDPLCVIEAMKMETVLRAASDSVVKEIIAVEGAALAVDAPILEFA